MQTAISLASAARIVSVLMGVALSAQARSIVWTGAVNNSFDTTTKNWALVDTAEATTFQNGDDAMISVGSTQTIEIKASGMKPKSLVLDVPAACDLTLTRVTNYLGDWTTRWEKRGAGRLVFVGTVLTSVDGGFVINGGTVYFGTYGQLSGLAQKTAPFVVNEGATLHLDCRNMFGGTGGLAITTPIEVTRGCLRISDSSAANAHMGLGPIFFEDAEFDYAALPGYANTYGRMTLSGKVTVRGTKPMTFAAPPYKNSGQDRVHLWFVPLTEFDIADVTGDGMADCTNGFRLVDAYTNTTSTAYVPSGLVKTGAGTMILTNKLNSFTGDIEVREGTLQAGFDLNANQHLEAGSTWYLGNMTTTERAREIRVSTNGTLFIPNRNVFGMISSTTITNDQSRYNFTVVLDGGTLKFADAQGVPLPRITFRNGGHIAEYNGLSGAGALQVMDTFKVEGEEPFVWPWIAGASLAQKGLLVNGYPETKFDIADITGDGEVDADIGRPLLRWNRDVLKAFRISFRKTGVGTLRLSQPSFAASSQDYLINGEAKVEEGTLQVDGDLACASGIVVRAGAYVSGTGKVANVVLNESAGLRGRVAQTVGLNVTNVVTLAANGKIRLDGLGSRHEREIDVPLMTAAKGIVGAANLASYAIEVDGRPARFMCAFVSGNTLRVKGVRGTMVILR